MDKGIGFTVFMALLLVPGVVSAACSIGANPLHMNVRAVPGETVTATWNLYNIHGDRITHVIVSGDETNPEWDVSLEPGLHNATYNVTGVLQTIEEHVGLEPTEVVDSVPDPKPEGMDYVNYPGGDGYIPVRPVDIIIEVPEGAELFQDYVFSFQAVGKCVMEAGTVIPGIATKLELTVRTVSGEGFYETPAGNEVCADGADNDGDGLVDCDDSDCETDEACIGGGGAGFDITGFLIANAPWVGVIVILLVFLAYFGLTRKRLEEGYRDYSYAPE